MQSTIVKKMDVLDLMKYGKARMELHVGNSPLHPVHFQFLKDEKKIRKEFEKKISFMK